VNRFAVVVVVVVVVFVVGRQNYYLVAPVSDRMVAVNFVVATVLGVVVLDVAVVGSVVANSFVVAMVVAAEVVVLIVAIAAIVDVEDSAVVVRARGCCNVAAAVTIAKVLDAAVA
jgi:hypothetical protein